MPELEFRDQSLEISIENFMTPFSSLTFLVSNTCGWSVQKPWADMWASEPIMHSPWTTALAAVVKPLHLPAGFTHLASFLCTLFQHMYTILQSVRLPLVHTIHSAYIYERNEIKGNN